MNLTEAAAFQSSLDAVMDGSANQAQCTEAQAVVFALRSYLQEAELRAKAIPQRRTDFLSLLSDDVRAKVLSQLPPDTGEPRLAIDPFDRSVDTPANIAAAAAARQAETDAAAAEAAAQIDQAEAQRSPPETAAAK